jgi:hypothetical protein
MSQTPRQIFSRYQSGYKIDQPCKTRGWEYKWIEVWWENPKERDHMEDLDRDDVKYWNGSRRNRIGSCEIEVKGILWHAEKLSAPPGVQYWVRYITSYLFKQDTNTSFYLPPNLSILDVTRFPIQLIQHRQVSREHLTRYVILSCLLLIHYVYLMIDVSTLES